MRLIPRSLAASLGSMFSPEKRKNHGAAKDKAAPSVPAVAQNIPTPSAVTDLTKDIPTSSAAAPTKDAPTPSPTSADSAKEPNTSPPTVTTTATLSVTDTTTITSAAITITEIQHDLATVATTIPTTITIHSPTSATTIHPTTTGSRLSSPLLPAATPPSPPAKKQLEPAVITSVVFGLATLGLLGVICYLILRQRRVVAKAKKEAAGTRYAEEFDWVGPEAKVEMEMAQGRGRKDEWGVKQKEAWGVV